MATYLLLVNPLKSLSPIARLTLSSPHVRVIVVHCWHCNTALMFHRAQIHMLSALSVRLRLVTHRTQELIFMVYIMIICGRSLRAVCL
jgi:hypothetical protein